jgi:ribosome recycling factor
MYQKGAPKKIGEFTMKELLKETEEKMKKSTDRLAHEFTTIRAGRANPAVLDKVQVDYYGVPTPIQQMAAVSVSEARILVIQPWDVTSLKAIEKAILASDVGITPTNDGKVLRLVFPQLTEDRRKDLCKEIKKLGEETKVAVRNVRRDSIEKLKAKKKASELTEDEVKDGEKKIQDLTDKFVAEIDKMVAEKDKEIMSI